MRRLKVRIFLKKNTGFKESIDEGNYGSSERNLRAEGSELSEMGDDIEPRLKRGRRGRATNKVRSNIESGGG